VIRFVRLQRDQEGGWHVPADEIGQDDLRAELEDADRDARVLQLLRSPEHVERLAGSGALDLDFDLTLDLSRGLAAQGDREVAELVARSAFATGDAKTEAAGGLALAWLQVTGGKARKAWSEVGAFADSTDVDVLGEATYLRGVILQVRRRHAQAAEEYRRAMSIPRRKTAGMSAVALGEMLAETGDREGAVAALTFGHECGDPYAEAEAALKLAILHDQAGDLGGALPLYREAAESGSAAAPQAAFHLGEILRLEGEADAARESFEDAYATGDPEFAPRAAVNLGAMYMELDEPRVDEAYQCFETAAASADPAISSRGHCYLGVLLAGGAPEDAERHLRTALKTGDDAVKQLASEVLEKMRSS
jgi:tetratricopeptide (TPR) repeat protein